ncbi:LysR family transcriptional regulator [Flindersiella endophytica]
MGCVDLTIAQLEALLAVSDAGSFTGAAEVLGLTQSGVSRTIASLERRFGAALVHRGSHGAALTGLGRQVAAQAKAAMEPLRAIESLAVRTRTSEPGRLRVGAVASALVRLVPDAVRELAAEVPELDVLTVQGDDDELAEWLGQRTVDVAVGTAPPAAGDGWATEEIADEFLAVLPSNHRLGRADRVTLAELAAAGVADPGGTCGPLLAARFADHGVEWCPDHTVRDVETVIAMVAAGITAGVVPALAAPRPAPSRIVLLPLDPPLRRTLFVHYEVGHQPSAALAAALGRAAVQPS